MFEDRKWERCAEVVSLFRWHTYVTVTVIDISAETTTGQTTDTEGGVEVITVHSELVIGAGD